jgi:hypothetical protein
MSLSPLTDRVVMRSVPAGMSGQSNPRTGHTWWWAWRMPEVASVG